MTRLPPQPPPFPPDDPTGGEEFFESLGIEDAPAHWRHTAAVSHGDMGDIFDFGFTKFITPAIVKVVYVANIVVAIVSDILLVVAAAESAADKDRSRLGYIIVGLAVSIVLQIVYLLVLRVFLEMVLILFRIEENQRRTGR